MTMAWNAVVAKGTKTPRLIGTAALFFLIWSGAATATSLPAPATAVYYASLAPCCSHVLYSDPTALESSDSSWNDHNAGSVSTSPPYIQAQTETNPGEYGHEVLATLDYYFIAVGAPGIVPVNFTTNLYSSATNASASAALQIYNSNNIFQVCTGDPICTNSRATPATPTFNGTLHVSVPANENILVHLFVEATTTGVELNGCRGNCGFPVNPFGGTAFASADPYIFLDQDILDQGYTLSISPGVSNIAAVTTPVPSGLPLFATGLAGLGWLARRRQRRRLQFMGQFE